MALLRPEPFGNDIDVGWRQGWIGRVVVLGTVDVAGFAVLPILRERSLVEIPDARLGIAPNVVWSEGIDAGIIGLGFEIFARSFLERDPRISQIGTLRATLA